MTIQINGTSGISGVDGSATTPALQGTDTNTGISFGTDTVNVVTGGSTRTTVDSSGRLLVGTSTAQGNNRLQLEGSASGASEWAGISLRRGVATASLTSGQYLGAISFQSQGGAEGGVIRAQCDDNWSASSHPTRLTFETTASSSTSPTEQMRILNNGAVAMSTDTTFTQESGAKLTVRNNYNYTIACKRTGTGGEGQIAFKNGNGLVGSITTSGSATSFNTSSDYRLKENIVDLDGAIDRVKQLAPKRFNFVVDETDTAVDGFLAHEAQAVVPEAVTGTHNEVDEEDNPVYQGIDQSKLVPLLTAALQEAIGKIEALETRVAQLEGGTN
jgi:hypothetical protein